MHPPASMPRTVPKDRRVDGPTSHGEEICHIVTEEDPDTALCGKDVTGWPWNPPWPYCVVCLDLMQSRRRRRGSAAVASFGLRPELATRRRSVPALGPPRLALRAAVRTAAELAGQRRGAAILDPRLLALELLPGRDALRVAVGAHRAARLAVVLAVREAAARGELLDVGEGLADAAVPQPGLADARACRSAARRWAASAGRG